MEQYRVLLIGAKRNVIDDFFDKLAGDFLILTSSLSIEDIKNHLNLFKPNALIFCIGTEEDMETGVAEGIREKVRETGVVFAIMGMEEECRSFCDKSQDLAEISLVRPISVYQMRDKIVHYLENLDAMRCVVENASEDENEVKRNKTMRELTEEKRQREKEEREAREKEEAEREKAEKERLEAEAREKTEAEKADRKHILVVDDDPMMLRVVKSDLGDKYEVATAISGKVALKYLESRSTDLVLLDYEMPGENGADVIGQLRKDSRFMDLPVVFLTGLKDKEKIRELLNYSPQGYLLKPIDAVTLTETVKKLIG